MDTLEELMNHIASVWKCNEERYPELGVLSEAGKNNFRIKHSALHIAKSLGKLAALSEDFDHNQQTSPEDQGELQKLAVKIFINSLKLAEESGLDAEKLLKKAPDFIR